MPKIFLFLLICAGFSCQRQNAPTEAEILVENILQKQAQHETQETLANQKYLLQRIKAKTNPNDTSTPAKVAAIQAQYAYLDELPKNSPYLSFQNIKNKALKIQNEQLSTIAYAVCMCPHTLYLGVNLLNKNNPTIDSLEIFPLRNDYNLRTTILEASINGQKMATYKKNSFDNAFNIPFRFKKIGLNWLDIKLILKNPQNVYAPIDTIIQTLPYYVRP